MQTWIIIIALLSIAVTALLISILMRVNAPGRGARQTDAGAGADAGGDAGGSLRRDSDHDVGDSGGDGGGDGGGD